MKYILYFLFLMENSTLKIFGSMDVKITPDFSSSAFECSYVDHNVHQSTFLFFQYLDQCYNHIQMVFDNPHERNHPKEYIYHIVFHPYEILNFVMCGSKLLAQKFLEWIQNIIWLLGPIVIE